MAGADPVHRLDGALADALTTALSLVATYGQSRKRWESWWFWITADLIYIPLYVYKHLHLTSVLYLLFLGPCLIGLRSWYGDLRRDAATRQLARSTS